MDDDIAMIPASIARTAFDSLHSKLSSINAGWLDGGRKCDDGNISSDDSQNNNKRGSCEDLDGMEDEDNNLIHGNLGSYCKLLRRIAYGTTTTEDSCHDTTNDATTREEKKKMTRRRRRRQTPLINAFYAARIAVMTHIIERWMDNVVVDVSTTRKNADDDSNNDDYRINVVILGCGMDACGIWCKQILLNNLSASSSLPFNNAHRPKVMIYELDANENCLLKRHALITSGLIHESPCTNTATIDVENVKMVENDTLLDNCCSSPMAKKELFHTACKGKILLDNIVSDTKYDQNDNNSDDEDDYFLIAVDLRDKLSSPSLGVDNAAKNNNSKSILSGVFQHIGLDFTTQPTLVLSELVLAYLGQDGGDAVLHSIASDVILAGAAANKVNNNNMFVCLEPIFSSSNDKVLVNEDREDCKNQIMMSIEESYARDYGRQFLGKLQRGDSRHNSSASKKMFKYGNDDLSLSSSLLWLHPLGSNSKSVHLRLQRCGFPGICYAPMGQAVANVARYRRSMGVVNFLRAKEPFDEHSALILNLNCYGVVCAFSSASFDPLKRLVVEDDLENIRNEQIDICPWFKASRVRVSSSDFYFRPIASASEDGQVRELYARLYSDLFDSFPSIRKMVKSALKSDLGLIESNIEIRSAIRNCYKLKGGDFWISSDINGRVVGCIGLCLREEHRRPSNEKYQTVVEYEIHRLSVDEQYRGKGVGSSLLSYVEQWVRNKHTSTVSKSVTTVTVNLKAVTPDCLTVANKLYESVAYVKEGTFHSGNIIMNVYYKGIQLQ